MNTWDPSLRKASLLPHKPSWFEVFLPVQAAALMGILLLILPIFILTAESLLAPVSEYLRSLLIPVNAGMNYTSLPVLLWIKIAIFGFFTFTGVALLLLKIACLYHETWAGFFPQAHPHHRLYQPDPQASMIALFNWTLFRAYKIWAPFVLWLTLTLISGSVLLWLFTAFTDSGFLTFQVQVSLSFFVLAVLGFFTMLALFKSLWRAFSTVLGDVAAILEPDRPTQVLFERAQKLAFGSVWTVILYPLYGLFYVSLLAEVVLLVLHYDVVDLLSFHPDLGLIYALTALTLVVYITLDAMKMITYHDALGRYYRRRLG